MKKFESPKLDVQSLEAEDIIATSPVIPGPGVGAGGSEETDERG